MYSFRKTITGVENPVMPADVVIVGAGPAGLACAIRLAQLIDGHNTQHPDKPLSKDGIYVLEKSRELGLHCLSGAVVDPRSLNELLPGWQSEAPIEAAVHSDSVSFLTASMRLALPVTPPPLNDHGCYMMSVGKLVKWLGKKAEDAGITIFTSFAGTEFLYDQDKVVGVQTDDKGVDKHGEKKDNFEPGYRLESKITVLAEGTCGSLTKTLVKHYAADRNSNPQIWGLGVKELWELPAGRIKPGEVFYSMGYPLTSSEYGGSWIYGLQNNIASLGYVTALEYAHPETDPHHVLQEFKKHPWVAKLLDSGKMIRYGAKTLPYGGWWSLPQLAGDGWLIIGDSAGFLNPERLKGIHLAIKSGMLAAETIYEALVADDCSEAKLKLFSEKITKSWVKKELFGVRNFHQGFAHGLFRGIAHAGLQFVTGGRGVRNRYPSEAGYKRMRKRKVVQSDTRKRVFLGHAKGDGILTFDKLTDVFFSGTKHEEDQPIHLCVSDTSVCSNQCAREYGNPCQYFCPAGVYEMVEAEGDPSKKELKINASNCVHCKTCDIMDPYQIIDWVPPEGGGGPNYEGM